MTAVADGWTDRFGRSMLSGRLLPCCLPILTVALVALAQPRYAPWLMWAALGAGLLLAASLALPGRHGDWVVGAGLLGLVGAVYLVTLSPTTDIGDSLEWVIIARDLGVGHGPGYPLYVLLGHLIQQLPLVRSVAKLRLLRLGYSLPEVAAALNLSQIGRAHV